MVKVTSAWQRKGEEGWISTDSQVGAEGAVGDSKDISLSL